MTSLMKCHYLQNLSRCCYKQTVLSHTVGASQIYQLSEINRKPINRSYSCLMKHRSDVTTHHVNHRPCIQHQLFPSQQCTYFTDVLYSMSQAGFVFFNTVHSLTGTPWWLSIVLVVVPMRVGLQILKEYYLRRNTNRLVGVQEELKTKVVPHITKLTHHIGSNLSEAERKMYKEEIIRMREKDFKDKIRQAQQVLYRRRKCHPMKPVAYGVLHIPIWISLSLSLREMAGRDFFLCKPREDICAPSLSTEGVLWFPDLAMPDPLLILPVITVFSFWTSMEISKLREMTLNVDGSKQPTILKIMDYVAKLGLVLILLVSPYFPSAVTFYWSISSMSANMVTLMLLNPRVQQTLKMESLSIDSKTPYRDIYNSMKVRYNPHNWYKSILSKVSRSKVKQDKDSSK